MAIDPTTTKYLIKASIHADGVVDKPDIIGAIFGQTEGLLGNELDLRDLQKSARIGRIEVEVDNKGGKTSGHILLPSAMDKVESAILAAGIETIDRIGPCKATIKVEKVEDMRISKRKAVVDRAKQLLATLNEDPSQDSARISDEVRSAVQVAEMTRFRNTKLPAGPNVDLSDSVILVEGRNDVLNLLKCGIKNAVAVEGTNIPQEIKDLSKEKTTVIFVDGDRGGELIARELLQTCDVDFVARAPNTREVEELPHKLVMKCLKNKLTAEQFVSQMGITIRKDEDDKVAKGGQPAQPQPQGGAPQGAQEKGEGGRGRGRRGGRGRGGRDEAKEEKPEPRTESRAEPKETPKEAPKEMLKEKPKGEDPRAGLKDHLGGLSGTLKAVLLDDAGQPLKEDLAVRELADTLKSGKDKVHTVVFDGVITQRLLDIAADKKIQTIVGVKMGNVTKVPDTVEILTRDDLS